MGQYHMLVNLDKREKVRVGNLRKLMEQCGTEQSTATGLWLLLAASNGSGPGDAKPHRLVGRWAGDRIVIIGTDRVPNIPGIAAADLFRTVALCIDLSMDVEEMLEREFDVGRECIQCHGERGRVFDSDPDVRICARCQELIKLGMLASGFEPEDLGLTRQGADLLRLQVRAAAVGLTIVEHEEAESLEDHGVWIRYELLDDQCCIFGQFANTATALDEIDAFLSRLKTTGAAAVSPT